MAITCECTHCTTRFWAPNSFAGRNIPCPVCEKSVRVPGGDSPLTEQAAPRPKTPSLVDVLEEEMGPASAIAAAANLGPAGTSPGPAESAWGSRTASVSLRRSTIRLSRRAALAVAGAGLLAFYALILMAVPKLGIVLGVLLFLGGMALVFSGVCWQLYLALRESTSCMVWSLVTFPFYYLFFLMSRWERTRKSLAVTMAGIMVCVGSGLAIAYASHLANPKKAPAASRPDRSRPKSSLKARPALEAPVPADASPAAPDKAGQTKGPGGVAKPAAKTPPADEDYDIPPAKDLITVPPSAEPKPE